MGDYPGSFQDALNIVIRGTRERRGTEGRGEGETMTRERWSGAAMRRECQRPPEDGKGKEMGLVLKPLEGAWPC